jgi:hypothetical protein
VSINLTDPLFRQLYQRLAEDIDNRVNGLSQGAALILGDFGNIDATATALKYQYHVAYIAAMQATIDLMVEIDHDRYGKRDKNQETGD